MIVAIKEFFTAEMINDVISAAIGLIAFILLYLLIKKITKKILTKKERLIRKNTLIGYLRISLVNYDYTLIIKSVL
mgnify:CR=1 FL=1